MIGIAAVLLMGFNGRIAGISGISAGTLSAAAGDRLWRFMFLLVLVAAPLLFSWLSKEQPAFVKEAKLPTIIVAGFLVGFGSQMGSGCTSGHGVCGISRLSLRSIVATVACMAAGILTVTMVRVLTGTQL